jgi:phenylacetic acid degradation protein
MPCYEFEGIRPVVDPSAFVHPTASLIGDVIVGPHCLVGPGASLRADIGRIVLHAGANVQDNCTVHCFPGKEVIIETDGHIGHGAVLHSCTIKRNAMVGINAVIINAVIMDDAVIGEDSFVAAMALVKAETIVPPRTLMAGIPAKVVRDLTDDEIAWKSAGTRVYQHLTKRYLTSLVQCSALSKALPERRTLPVIDYRPKHEQPKP